MNINGDIVRLLRTTKGIDQRTLARETSISQAAICMIETGKLPISPRNNQRLVQFFNVNEADLLHAKNIVHMTKRFE